MVRRRAIVGALLYVSVTTRPDVALAVGLLSRALECPTPALLCAARRVLEYLVTTKELGIRYTVGADLGLLAVDATVLPAAADTPQLAALRRAATAIRGAAPGDVRLPPPAPWAS